MAGLLRADGGAVAVEFALLAPLLSLILLGGIDVAIAARSAMAAQASAEAAAAAIVRLVPAPAPEPVPGSNTAGLAIQSWPDPTLPALPALPAEAFAGVASADTSARLFWACAARDPAAGADPGAAVLEETRAPRCANGERPAAHVEVQVGGAPGGLGLAAIAGRAGLTDARLVARLG
jgi:Flp pilus assembly pilin Flp